MAWATTWYQATLPATSNINWTFPAITGDPANAAVHVEPTMAMLESINAHLVVRMAELELSHAAILAEKDARILSLEGSQSWSS